MQDPSTADMKLWLRNTDQIRYGKAPVFALKLPNCMGNLVSPYKFGLLDSQRRIKNNGAD
jgi:hypothetical protein